MRRISVLLLSSVSLLVAACNPLSRRPPPALHDFGPVPVTERAALPVVVEAPTWLEDRRIRYRMLFAEPTRVRFYADDRWLASPPALLAQKLASVGVGEDYRLRIQLSDFEQIFAARYSARIVLRFRAVAEEPATGRVIAERSFAFARPTSSADAAGAVTAFAAATDDAVRALKLWLLTLPGKHEATAPAPERR